MILRLLDVSGVPSVEAIRTPEVILGVHLRLLIGAWLGPQEAQRATRALHYRVGCHLEKRHRLESAARDALRQRDRSVRHAIRVLCPRDTRGPRAPAGTRRGDYRMARVIYRGCFWERSIPYDTARNTDDVRVLTQQAAGPRGGRIWRFGTEMQATQEAPPRFTPALAFGSACGQNGGTDLPARTAPPLTPPPQSPASSPPP